MGGCWFFLGGREWGGGGGLCDFCWLVKCEIKHFVYAMLFVQIDLVVTVCMIRVKGSITGHFDCSGLQRLCA